ncbi:DNA repair protein RadC [Luteimonas sp. MC1750]|nr:DNA repair protein RadC [Luteimonas sp. MC1750]QQO06821.1 DNA repair protein RadC [Luteimonas sp. MC1750]
MRFPKPLTNEQNRTLEQAEALLRSRVREGLMVCDPSAAGNMFRYRLASHDREVFSVAFLTTRHKVIAVEDMFAGTIDGAEIHPREIAKRALEHNAAAVLVSHNHPSGNLQPSAQDMALTSRLKEALKILDIRLLDHFVVSTEGYTSLAARGWV